MAREIGRHEDGIGSSLCIIHERELERTPDKNAEGNVEMRWLVLALAVASILNACGLKDSSARNNRVKALESRVSADEQAIKRLQDRPDEAAEWVLWREDVYPNTTYVRRPIEPIAAYRTRAGCISDMHLLEPAEASVISYVPLRFSLNGIDTTMLCLPPSVDPRK